jgi:ribosomal protein L37AE/L43A
MLNKETPKATQTYKLDEEKKVGKVCPVCGSTNTEFKDGKWICYDCGAEFE